MYQWLDQKWMFKHFLQSIESIVMPSRYLKVMKANSWYLCRAQTYVLSHSYILFCRDSSPGVEFCCFLWPPSEYDFCILLHAVNQNAKSIHWPLASRKPRSSKFGSVWPFRVAPRFVHHSALAGQSYFFVQHNYPKLACTSTKCLKTVSTFTAITSQKYDKCTKEESNCIEKTSNLDQSGIFWHCQQPYRVGLSTKGLSCDRSAVLLFLGQEFQNP